MENYCALPGNVCNHEGGCDTCQHSLRTTPRKAWHDVTQDTSDGYHTFSELYHHRAVLFSVICNDRPHLAWKSTKHEDGTMFAGYFIAGILTPNGQATYHYQLEYWGMFRVQELELAPGWDGHTPDDAIQRIAELEAQNLELLEEVVDALQDVVAYAPRPTATSKHADEALAKYEQQLKARGEA